MTNVGVSPWNDDRVEALKKLWLEGKSCSEISREFKGVVSRNAVIGKLHRMGLSQPDRGLPPVGRDRPMRAPKVERTRYAKPPKPGPQKKVAVVFGAAPTVRGQQAPRHTPAPEPLTPTKTLMELGKDDCRWIIGERVGRVFCGRASTDCSPYCQTH
ncbi:GcrA cell cycle regulator [Brevundimonas sp. BAL450]|uniref:GcrA family cell cycle regulator n=1 Tax=Brevundimonas sp. BAL450 TaxID=1708162 RepID=UPI0018CB36D3|nr:GcrA family cell cycle regulator [Brevundimonas sp. BAL450]MBG7616495.1 GcrA cell cycle regulator [Brevundimonas sp. BAL450]